LETKTKDSQKQTLSFFMIFHEKTRPHFKPEVTTYIKAKKLQVMCHPPDSPELIASDSWLKDSLKRHLPDQKDETSLFRSVTEVPKIIPQKC